MYCNTAHSLPRPEESIPHVMREEAAQRKTGHDAKRAHQAQCEGPVAMVPCANQIRISASSPYLKVCLHEGSKRKRKRKLAAVPPDTSSLFGRQRARKQEKHKRASKYISQEEASAPNVRTSGVVRVRSGTC
jgi:hypothetical protein